MRTERQDTPASQGPGTAGGGPRTRAAPAAARKKQEQAPTTRLHTYVTKVFWIEIELVGEDSSPIPKERYEVVLPDGAIRDGELDETGWARIEGRGEGTCGIRFPDLDKDAWEFIESVGPR